MRKAIGMIEYRTVSAGITATDLMVKTADVDIIEAQTVCPGKYISIITGDLSAVRAAVDNAKASFEEAHIDSFVLETFDASQIIVAADNAVKTAEVSLIEIRLARGMCGKSYAIMTGEVAAVTAAIERAKDVVSTSGMFLDSSVIARPDKKLIEKIL